MAKQTLKSLLGASDERKQVELNLNPVALQPTIRSGGNYRVAVQQTPLTNSALQFADSLKQGVQLYGAAVEVSQRKAEQDVLSMSEADFDKFLTEGLDKESLNIFGYTKAYNQALAKKYYAEEMPTKLQAIAAELHKDPYKYKDPAQFEGAAIAAVNEAYDEADELLGGNVFSEQANNALKSATKADFVAKQQATYLQRMPEITRQNASEGAFNAFSKITKADTEAKAMIDAQIKSVTEAVGNRKEAAAIVTKAYLDNIEALAKQEGKEGLAQELLDELDSGAAEEKAGLQGKRTFGDDKVELFNTAENRLRIEQLEDDIENAGVSGYNAQLANAKKATASLYLEIYSLIKGKGGSEEAGITRLNELRDEIVKNKSIKIGDTVYDGSVETTEILSFIDGATSNPDLFIYNGKLSFIQQNTGQLDNPVRDLLSPSVLKSKLGNNFSIIGSEEFVLGRQTLITTALGAQLESEFESELRRLKFSLYDKNASLPQSEQIERFNDEYVKAVAIPMQKWLDTRLESLVPPTPEKPSTPARDTAEAKIADKLQEIDNNKYITEQEKTEFKEAHIQEEIDRQETINETLAFQQYPDGTRRLQGDVPDNEGTRMAKGYGYTFDPTHAYQTAVERGLFIDSDEQAQGFNAVHGSFGVNSQKRRNALKLYNLNPLWRFSEESPLEKATKKGRLRESFSLYGLTMQELAQDNFEANIPNKTPAMGKSKVSLTEVYGESNPFSSVPIVYNGSIKNTVAIVQGYMDDPTTALPEVFTQAAKNYGISPETMMKQMEAYLLTNNFISK